MARKRVVTRTVTETTATILCVNPTTNAVTYENYSLPSVSGLDNEKLLSKLRKFAKDGIIYAAITERKDEEILLEMDELDFYYYARKLPPRFLDSDATDDE